MVLLNIVKWAQVHRDIDLGHLHFWVLQRRYVGSNLDITKF